MSTNPYAPPRAEVDDVVLRTEEASPALWNPNAAALWSLLFSPVFGAALQMKNWQALGEPEKAAQSKQWVIGSIAVVALIVLVGMVLPESKGVDSLSRGAGIGLLVGWYMANGKIQVSHVAGRFGKSYPRKGWAKPLGYAVLGFIAFIAVSAVLGFVVGLVMG